MKMELKEFFVSQLTFWFNAEFFAVGLASFPGVWIRFMIQTHFSAVPPYPEEHPLIMMLNEYPWIVANLVGCFVMGFGMIYTREISDISLPLFKFLTTGLCGCITTFSTWENSIIDTTFSKKNWFIIFCDLIFNFVIIWSFFNLSFAFAKSFKEFSSTIDIFSPISLFNTEQEEKFGTSKDELTIEMETDVETVFDVSGVDLETEPPILNRESISFLRSSLSSSSSQTTHSRPQSLAFSPSLFRASMSALSHPSHSTSLPSTSTSELRLVGEDGLTLYTTSPPPPPPPLLPSSPSTPSHTNNDENNECECEDPSPTSHPSSARDSSLPPSSTIPSSSSSTSSPPPSTPSQDKNIKRSRSISLRNNTNPSSPLASSSSSIVRPNKATSLRRRISYTDSPTHLSPSHTQNSPKSPHPTPSIPPISSSPSSHQVALNSLSSLIPLWKDEEPVTPVDMNYHKTLPSVRFIHSLFTPSSVSSHSSTEKYSSSYSDSNTSSSSSVSSNGNVVFVESNPMNSLLPPPSHPPNESNPTSSSTSSPPPSRFSFSSLLSSSFFTFSSASELDEQTLHQLRAQEREEKRIKKQLNQDQHQTRDVENTINSVEAFKGDKSNGSEQGIELHKTIGSSSSPSSSSSSKLTPSSLTSSLKLIPSLPDLIREGTWTWSDARYFLLKYEFHLWRIAFFLVAIPIWIDSLSSHLQGRGITALALAPFGCWLRWALSRIPWLKALWPEMHIPTLLANLLGVFIYVMFLTQAHSHPFFLGMTIGFCGSLTTVSTFFAELHTLYYQKGPFYSLRYGFVTFFLASLLIQLVRIISSSTQ